jgi:hypothetical protein
MRQDDYKTKVVQDVIKNPTLFILILVFLGYIDIRSLPGSIEKIGSAGTENLEQIRNEIVFLRKDLREQIAEIGRELQDAKLRIQKLEREFEERNKAKSD